MTALRLRNSGGLVAPGFSLIELILVLLILGLAYGLVAPMISSGMDSLQLKALTRQISAALRQTRDESISSRKESRLTLDLENRRFNVNNRDRSYSWPETIDVKVFTATSEIVNETRAGVRFFPDGSSTGGRLTLTSNGLRQEIDIDWLTGRVKIL